MSCSLYRGDGSLGGLKNGVMLFFALSGFLLYRPFVTGTVDLRRYATNRLARILPVYLVALIGVSVLTGDDTFARQPLTYLLFLQNYDPSLWQGFLGVSWTLVLEVLERRPQLGPLALPASVGAALTYSAYLWHVDVLRDVEPVGLALIALMAIASAVYVVVERPILLIARGWVAASGGAASILGVPQSNSTNQATSEIGR